MPPPHTAVGTLAAAVSRLEESLLPARLDTQAGFFAALAPVLGGFGGLALRHADRLGPLVERRLAASLPGNALIRTTTAVTMISGGIKPNVLPQSARAVANFRVIPGDTVGERPGPRAGVGGRGDHGARIPRRAQRRPVAAVEHRLGRLPGGG